MALFVIALFVIKIVISACKKGAYGSFFMADEHAHAHAHAHAH